MDVGGWLRGLGLERYEQAFRDNDVDAEVLPELTADDLIGLGVASIGHRRKLLAAIAALRAGPTPSAATLPLAEPTSGAPAAAAWSSEAERRQLTVMFVDLVGSTALSSRLDPEDLRELIRAYQDAVAAEVARYEGHVAKFMGDGVLAYLGWPRAHEDDAERAVRAGLAAVAAVSRLATPAGGSGALAARVGVATGLVVVGDLLGDGAAREEAVVGETPNLAARLQALAEPGAVVVGEATRRLLGGLFELEELPAAALKGFAGTPRAFRVRGEGRRAEDRFEALRGTSLTPLVGRDDELALMVERWERAKGGEGGVVLLAGEAGIGKSRLLRAFRERLEGRPHVPLVQFCSPFHQATPLHPVTELLERTAGFARDDPPAHRLDKLEAMLAGAGADVAEAAPLLAALLSVPAGDRYPPLAFTPQRQRERTLETLLGLLAGLARRAPVLEVFEDVHWADPTTLEVMDLVVERVPTLPMLSVMTFRPEFAPRWAGRRHVTLLSLERLGRRQGTAIIGHLTGGRALPPEVLEQITARTDGVPLFVEELTKTVLESGLLREEGGRYALAAPLPPLAIPATLQDSLMARLDRLAPVKEVAQIGAAIGREFGHELLAAVAPLDEAELLRALQELAEAGLVFRHGTPPDATYTFKHALVRDAAYQSLLRSRRQQLHARIARVLEERFADVAEARPEVLARHCTEAGLTGKAVAFWHEAGRLAIQRSAWVEAAAHLRTALDLLARTGPGSGRSRKEIELRLMLGRVLLSIKGWASPEMGQAYTRARELCDELGEVPLLVPTLWGLFTYHQNRAEHETARAVAEDLLRLAERLGDIAAELLARRLLGAELVFLGDLPAARTHLERVVSTYDPQRDAFPVFVPHDSRITARNFLAWALLFQGRPDQALTVGREMLALAREIGGPYNLAFALHVSCVFHQVRGDRAAVEERAAELVALAAEQGFPHMLGTGTFFRGWARAAAGEVDQGVAGMVHGLAAKRATGAEIKVPYYQGLLAAAHATAGRSAEALALLAEALGRVERTGEVWFEAELHRLKGGVLLRTTPADPAEAEACFRKAIDVARAHGTKWWELRAATSLARLWAERGECRKAHDLLAPVHGWFAEGFDTPDLKVAGALLDELAPAPLGSRARALLPTRS